jgi:hypothetical protein
MYNKWVLGSTIQLLHFLIQLLRNPELANANLLKTSPVLLVAHSTVGLIDRFNRLYAHEEITAEEENRRCCDDAVAGRET